MVRVAVKSEYRGRGHASYLVRWLMMKSKQLGHGSVSTWAKPSMQPIALKLGFMYYFAAEADVPEEERDNSWMMYRDRPMELGLPAAELTEDLVVTSSRTSKKRSQAARRKEFKNRR